MSLEPLTIVDAANVVGSRPDGWWRDRAGAARRLIHEITSAHLPLGEIVIVLEGAARAGVPAGELDGVRVIHAPGSGDDQIVELVKSETQRTGPRPMTVITSDRQLRDRVAALGAISHGPRTFRGQLDERHIPDE
jgi:hypothetical protein